MSDISEAEGRLTGWANSTRLMRTEELATDLRTVLTALAEAREDAERFRALMRCGRIKMQGSAGIDCNTGERNGNNVHFGAEFWPEPLPADYRRDHPDSAAMYDRNTFWGRASLRALADAILEHEASLAKEDGHG